MARQLTVLALIASGDVGSALSRPHSAGHTGLALRPILLRASRVVRRASQIVDHTRRLVAGPVYHCRMWTCADDSPALIDATGTLTYAELTARTNEQAQALRGQQLLMLRMRNDIESVVALLSAWRAGVPVLPLDPKLSDAAWQRLSSLYLPDVGDAPAPHPDLALLLSTSGSTGSPKLVRLSRAAVLANAHGIAERLALTATECPALNLPLHYSYGLSVLTSHLVVGARVLLSDDSITTDAFWAAARAHGATSLAGVPYTYQLLRRMKTSELMPSSLVTFTQAGGRMEPALIEHFAKLAVARGGGLYVMYGQTEACARLAILPAADVLTHIGSVGRALPGARFEIAEPDSSGVGEIIAISPSVMMGYAESRADLARGDDLGGRLATGDLGRLDAADYLWITGRKKRIAKVFGARVSLDDLEAWVRTAVPSAEFAAAVSAGDKVVLVFVGANSAADQVTAQAARQAVCTQGQLPPNGVIAVHLAAVPRLANGKVDLLALAAQLEA